MKVPHLQLIKLSYSTLFLSVLNNSDAAPPSTDICTPLTDDFIGDLICKKSDVEKVLLGLNASKVSGPDGVIACLLQEGSLSVVPSIFHN